MSDTEEAYLAMVEENRRLETCLTLILGSLQAAAEKSLDSPASADAHLEEAQDAAHYALGTGFEVDELVGQYPFEVAQLRLLLTARRNSGQISVDEKSAGG